MPPFHRGFLFPSRFGRLIGLPTVHVFPLDPDGFPFRSSPAFFFRSSFHANLVVFGLTASPTRLKKRVIVSSEIPNLAPRTIEDIPDAYDLRISSPCSSKIRSTRRHFAFVLLRYL